MIFPRFAAQDFESSCVSEERPVFTMVAEEGVEMQKSAKKTLKSAKMEIC
tara:strand:+ start:337 stop:486 length:150 start_codon:yes stop_codon:yes gene_type:complete